jgi:hypothetical protein
VSLDMLSRVGSASSTFELTLLVTREMVDILHQVVFESSTDAVSWVNSCALVSLAYANLAH